MFVSDCEQGLCSRSVLILSLSAQWRQYRGCWARPAGEGPSLTIKFVPYKTNEIEEGQPQAAAAPAGAATAGPESLKSDGKKIQNAQRSRAADWPAQGHSSKPSCCSRATAAAQQQSARSEWGGCQKSEGQRRSSMWNSAAQRKKSEFKIRKCP